MSTEDLSKIKMEEITLNNSNIARIGLEVDSFKNLNKPLCSMSKLFDRGYESYLSQGKIRKFKPPENFTGIFNPSNGDCIPLFRERDKLWYIYYVAAPNATEASLATAKAAGLAHHPAPNLNFRFPLRLALGRMRWPRWLP